MKRLSLVGALLLTVLLLLPALGLGESYSPNTPQFWSRSDGSVYIGQMNEDGLCDGYGMFYAPEEEDTYFYCGEYKDGKRHGFGVAYTKAGKRFEGRFEDGTMKGLFEDAGGRELVMGNNATVFNIAEKIDGKAEGVGAYYYWSGEYEGRLFAGEYHNDEMSGYCVYFRHDDFWYVGNLRDGKYHDRNALAFIDGTLYSVRYSDSTQLERTPYEVD